MTTIAALPYREPGIIAILILSSFLLSLNILNYILNRIVYCGLVGQILIGIAWGTPGAGWLDIALQQSIVKLGYLGLILIVYEGGLATNLKTLRANLILSATVAAIGISCPIGLSFVLRGLLDITPLQAFAAGAALCSTSLGTTFTVLSTSGLADSRLGVVLSSAAMMDDVVGLVMVQVISSLGQTSSFDAITVVKPVLVSIGFAVVVPLFCVFAVKPLTIRFWKARRTLDTLGVLERVMNSRRTYFLLHTAVLLGMVTASSYAGTSNLFAAYLTGAAISWWSNLIESTTKERLRREQANVRPEPKLSESPPGQVVTTRSGEACNTTEATHQQTENPGPSESTPRADEASDDFSGLAIHEYYYKPAVETVLKPFFFASIGFSIPITEMFAGGIVWRGLVYAALMTFGKMLCGVCLVRFSSFKVGVREWKVLRRGQLKSCRLFCEGKRKHGPKTRTATDHQGQLATTDTPTPSALQDRTPEAKKKTTKLPKPQSLYPATILGSAMVARGEIGFLISSVAESRGIFRTRTGSSTSDLFLVVTWAILVCTVIGPVAVGVLVRRVKRLQADMKSRETGRRDPLGIWGVGVGSG